MQFPVLATFAALLSLSMASPSTRSVATADNGVTVLVNGEALEPEVSFDCIRHCAKILEEAVCLAAAIQTKDISASLECGVTVDSLCNCANCIPGLGTFLANHDSCVVDSS